jgi:hypothetical protein
MRNILIILISFISTFALATKVLPECDIVFYKNDTLLIDKEFSNIILKKINKQPEFKFRNNPVMVNYYTAYWQINESGISLIKVTNQNTFDWKKLNQSDTLDLKKAFGKRYKDGKVSFKSNNLTLYLHKPFILRSYWSGFPTYLEDYTVRFKENRLIDFDTLMNYKNDSLRLNRYSRVQLDENVFNLITNSITVNTNVLKAKRIEFSVTVKINNDGIFDSLELSQIQVTDFSDSVFYHEFADSIIQVEKITKILKQTFWDETNNTNNDESVVSYEFDFVEMKLTHERFTEYLIREKKYLEESLPWFIRGIYEN